MSADELCPELVVNEVTTLADDVVGLTLAFPDGRALPEWTPGAHIDVQLPNGLLRQYSLCGDPGDRSAYRVAVLREPESRGGSRCIHEQAVPGWRLPVRGPRNRFPLQPAERYLFIGGGIGITPIVPMLGAASAAGVPWRLVYGGRRRASMAFAADLVDRYPGQVDLMPEDELGLLPLGELLGTPTPGTLVYTCGPERLLTAVEGGCARWPHGTLHLERFAAKEQQEATGEDTEFEVELSRSGRTLTVPVGCTLLAALAEAGVVVESACEEGICGTCETAVLSGEPDHRDSVLTEDERAANDTCSPASPGRAARNWCSTCDVSGFRCPRAGPAS